MVIKMDIDYKVKYEQILKEKEEIEKDFGQKRAQFRKLFLDCESQLKSERASVQEMELQVKSLNTQIEKLTADNEGIKAAAMLSQQSKEEEFSALKSKYQEEVASLTQILQETNKINDPVTPKESPSTSPDHSTDKGTSDSIMAMLPKTISRKATTFVSNNKPKKSLDIEKINLEGTQRKENKELKAEIGVLVNDMKLSKIQLVNADDNHDSSSKNKIAELRKYLESEKSARSDLEMYVAVLNTQKGVLQEDSDKLKRELHNVCRLFEQEKSNHNELKQTWKLANEQFLSQQNKWLFELDNMKKILSPQQLEQISKIMRNFSNSENSSSINTPLSDKKVITTKKSTEHSENIPKNKNSSLSTDLIDIDSTDGPSRKFKNDRTGKSSPSTLKKKAQIYHQVNTLEPTTLKDSVISALFPAAYLAKQFSEMAQGVDMKDDENVHSKPLDLSSSSDSESSEDDLEKALSKQNRERYLIEEATEVKEDNDIDSMKTHLKKSNSSDDILSPTKLLDLDQQNKSLSQNDISLTSISSTNKTLSTSVTLTEADSRNEPTWSDLGENMSHTCMMCQNYEKQLQRLQKEYMVMGEREENLVITMSDLENQVNTEKDKFVALEKSVESASLDSKTQMNIYCTNQNEVDKQVQLLFTQVQQFQMDIHNELRELSESRDRAFAEKTSLKEELDQLKDQHFDSMQLSPSKNDSLKSNPTVNEERLKNEIMFLKDQIVAEKFDRETTESVLQSDLNNARQEIGALKHQLGKTRRNPAESEDLMS